MAEAKLSEKDESSNQSLTNITRTCSKQNKRKNEGITNNNNDGGKEHQNEDENCVKTNHIENDDWKPIEFSEEENENIALKVIIEHVSPFEPDSKQHFLLLPHKLPVRNLTQTVLHRVGFRNLDKCSVEGRLQIGVLKPLPFATVTDNLDNTIGYLLRSIISHVILYIKVKKMFDDEEERLEYREVPSSRGTGYLINDYFFLCDRQSNRKQILYLRCCRQRKESCPSRAKILRELKLAVLINKNHNHPPPNIKIHEFMHRCRNESREPKNFTRNLKDVYDEICRDILSNCSSDEVYEVESAIKDWESVKKIMQKCRSRAMCSTSRVEIQDPESCDQPDVTQSGRSPFDGKSIEKAKRQKLDNNEVNDKTDLLPSTQNFMSLRDAAVVIPLPVTGAPFLAHQGLASSFHTNGDWTAMLDNFMSSVQTSNAN